MGMYTALNLDVDLKGSTPGRIIDTLEYMTGVGEEPKVLPEHPLFHTQRWRFMLLRDSCTFAAQTHSTLERDDTFDVWHLGIKCNLKNYAYEIDKFLDWISPYLDHYSGDFLGFTMYEEDRVPTLIYYKKTREDTLFQYPHNQIDQLIAALEATKKILEVGA